MLSNRYLVRLVSFACTLSLIVLGGVIGQSPGYFSGATSTFLIVFGTFASGVVLVIHAFDLGGPVE